MKIYLDMVGCRLNQSEIESLAQKFLAAGHEIVSTAGNADLAVINTCAVTGEASSDSRQKIRQIARLGSARVVVTGCWATLDPKGAASLPAVEQVVLNDRKDDLVENLFGRLDGVCDSRPFSRQPLPGLRMRTRSFIKIQDGCDNRCAYCVAVLARGPARSHPVEAVMADVLSALAGEVKEVVLTGMHLASWGSEFGLCLRELVAALLSGTDVPRLRLSSLEPWDLDADFFSLWRDPRLCRQLHLPLQSGSATVLKRMRRKVTPVSFARLVKAARSAVPEMAITTDVIVGFPGESEAEFGQTMDFVRRMDFAGGHVFTYSARPGTEAARLPGQIHASVRKERNAVLRNIFKEQAFAYNSHFLGSRLNVLWESSEKIGNEEWRLSGLTDNYIRVEAVSTAPIWNQFSTVELVRSTEDGLFGKICLPDGHPA